MSGRLVNGSSSVRYFGGDVRSWVGIWELGYG